MIATRVISVRGLNPAVMLADPNFAYVGRKCYGWPGSPWGNPFRVYSSRMQSFDNRLVGGLWLAEASKAIGDLPPLEKAVELHRRWILSQPDYLANLYRLRGKALGCWCGAWTPGEPEILCHAVTLARLADESAEGGRP
jgi:hypothetical protein